MTNIISSVQKSVLVKSETPVGQVVQRVSQKTPPVCMPKYCLA